MNSIAEQNRHVLARKVYLKYTVLRVRMKLSFLALTRRCTVEELIVKQIVRSYEQFEREGLIPPPDRDAVECERGIFEDLICGAQAQKFLLRIIE